MKRTIVVVLAALALMAGFAVPASAQTLPPDVTNRKFWSPLICIDGSSINGDYYQVAVIAQKWNIASDSTVKFDYSTDCAADGYPPSRRMVVGLYNGTAADGCLLVTNNQTAFYNGAYRWTNGPGFYINKQNACIGTQTRRNHVVSLVTGYALGLAALNSAGYNSRVMNQTAWSYDNVPYPDSKSGALAYQIYTGAYCDPPFSGC